MSGDGLPDGTKIEIRINGVAMEPTLVASSWIGECLNLQLACRPQTKAKEDVQWDRLEVVFGRTPSERRKAVENGGSFNFKGKVLGVVRTVTSVGQPVVLVTFAQKTRVTVAFWERHKCSLVTGDRVRFYNINVSKYYGGCLEVTYFTRIVKYQKHF